MKELQYEQIKNTELWALFERKCAEQNMGLGFITAVGSVCNNALDLSQYIIHFFPTFTLHNDLHSANVCRWMYRLLGDMAEELTAYEAAMLLMAACCHDIGMSVSDAQREEMSSRSYPGWDAYFARYLDDDEEYCHTGVISEGMLRNLVRVNHHERIGENLKTWPPILNAKGVKREDLLTICRSHGTDLDPQKLKYVRGKYDLMLCAVLLRLADLLDYDAGRAPEALFRHMGLDKPKTAEAKHSAGEFGKNQAGTFDDYIEGGIIRYNAEYEDPQLEQDVQAYLDWVEKELDRCAENLIQTPSHWNELRLPHKISTEGVERRGYAAGKFCMTMDQDKVIELLAGKNLYPDPGVFVRELLQNAIDAVLMRAKQEKDFALDQGRIIIDTWPGEAGDTWFRIRDNGTGMDEHIINNYFLKVGRSYYTSDEFRAANRRAVGGAYTAISRFGIGILSCFMTDPDYTELKVSTKRFGERDRNGIRLDVTGLHGYYYLAHEAETLEKGDFVQQMPSPDDDNRGYRTEPGTTICVKTNLFRMGTTKSFREILDKYVQFPEVRVEYHDAEEDKVYPTQQELMEAVHALNPDGVVKDYVFEISDDAFEKLKEAIPIAQWAGKPAFVLNFHPLDWLSDSEKMTGVSMTVEMKYTAVCPELKRTDAHGEEWLVRPIVECSTSMHNHRWVMGRFGLSERKVHREGFYTIELDLNAEETWSYLPSQVRALWDSIGHSLRRAEADGDMAAYNGVLVAQQLQDSNYVRGENAYVILLLREDYLPEVNLARDAITKLPLEAACGWAVAQQRARLWYPGVGLSMPTERELAEVLAAHQGWREYLGQPRNTEEMISCRDDLFDRLNFLAEKGSASVFFDFNRDWKFAEERYRISDRPDDGATADFPIGMFAFPEEPDSPLAYCGWGSASYNRSHPFSRWLIRNRAALAEMVPVVYDTLIQAMVQESNLGIRNMVNAILTRLRSFEGNCFGINDDLFLTEKDFRHC